MGKKPPSFRRCHLQCRRRRFYPWVVKIAGRRKWQPTPVFWPGESHGQRSLAVCTPWGHKESDTTERLNNNLVIWHGADTILLHWGPLQDNAEIEESGPGAGCPMCLHTMFLNCTRPGTEPLCSEPEAPSRWVQASGAVRPRASCCMSFV